MFARSLSASPLILPDETKWNPLYCEVLLVIGIQLYMWMFATVGWSSPRWSVWCPCSFNQTKIRLLFLMPQHKHALCVIYVYEMQPAPLHLSLACLAQSRRPSWWKVEPHIHPSCCQTEVNPRDQVQAAGRSIDTLQTAGSTACRNRCNSISNTLTDLIAPV